MYPVTLNMNGIEKERGKTKIPEEKNEVSSRDDVGNGVYQTSRLLGVGISDSLA